MKGKTFIPSHVFNEFYDVDIGSDFTTFKYPIKNKTIKKFKVNTREFSPIRYMWKSSIPDTWFKLADPSRFYNIRVERLKNKNTLQFLEETQKYIYNIRKPLAHTQPLNRKKKSEKTMEHDRALNREVKTAVSTTRTQIKRNLLSADASKSSFLTSTRQELFPKVSSFESFK